MKVTLKDRKTIAVVVLILLIFASIAINFNLFSLKKQQDQSKDSPIPLPPPKVTSIKIERDNIKPLITHYDGENFRDPFTPLIVKKLTPSPVATPLEMYDLEELKLIGIITDYKNLALFKTPDGKFYIAKEKDKIGNSGGIITKILPDTLEIKEPPTIGERSPKIKQIKLKTEEKK